MKQQILNYEYELIEKQTHYSQPYLRVTDPHNLRYTPWRLNQIIDKIVQKPDYSIKWIGSDPNAHVLAFLYCMLTACLAQNNIQEDLFLQFKYSLYQESKQALSISQQKVFVQHLGLIEDSKNICQFLKKSSYLQAIFTKLFLHKCSQMNRRKFNSNLSIKYMKNQELEWYSSIFPFTKFNILNQNCFNLIVDRHNFFIVEEKDCYFVVQQSSHKMNTYLLQEMAHRKKIKTEMPIDGAQFFEQMREYGVFSSNHELGEKFGKTNREIISRSQSRQGHITQQEEKKQKNETSIQERLRQIKKVDQKHRKSYLTTKIQTLLHFHHGGKKRKSNQSHQVHQHNRSKIQFYDMRTSIKDEKLYKLIATPNVSAEKISVQKQQKNRSGNKKRIGRVYSPAIEMPQIVEREQNAVGREKFIYQSLNREQAMELRKQWSPKTRSKIPKFLIKRSEEQLFSFSKSGKKQGGKGGQSSGNIWGQNGAGNTMIRSYKEHGSFTKRNN